MKLLNMSDIIPTACALTCLFIGAIIAVDLAEKVFLEDNKNTFFTLRDFIISSLGVLFFCAVGLLLLN